MNPHSIGLLLPLSGPQRKFGDRALKGFDASLRKMKEQGQELNYQIHVKDTKGSGGCGSPCSSRACRKE